MVAEDREATIREALLRTRKRASRELETALSDPRPELVGPLFARLHGATRTPELVALLRRVADVAPRIVCADYVPAFYWLARVPWVRPLASYAPTGKGRDSVFRGFAAHLLAAYPTPPFLYNAFFEEDAETLTKVVAAVAAGGSLFALCQSGALAAPLTRRMCHHVMLSPARTKLMTAIRAAQIAAERGNVTLQRAWMSTDAGRRLHDAELERFWHGILRWLVRNPVPFASVGPLVDYIDYRRQQDPAFRIKGRSANALLRAMSQWHAQLAQVKALDGRSFGSSGLQPGRFDQSSRLRSGVFLQRIWTVEEILTGLALAEEGRQMRHCVYSYAWAVESGRTSIWSMKLFDGTATHRCVTVEVRNVERCIVQARGRYNRVITPPEHQILVAWAGLNGLGVRLG